MAKILKGTKKMETPGTNQNVIRASASYSVTLRLRIPNQPGRLAAILTRLGQSGASSAEVSLLASNFQFTVRDVTILCRSEKHAQDVVELIKEFPEVKLLGWQDDTFALHVGGKLEVTPKVKLHSRDGLSRAYTPGVARVCTAIQKNPDEAFLYTIKKNCVAVVSDGSAVLGLGNIGALGAIPVMEGKSMLFKQFGGVDSFPICLSTQDPDEIVAAVKQIAPVFGGINLEDISAPRCFEIESRLCAELDIPVFHDDQHGTAVVVLAALLNALKIVGKKPGELKAVVNGFGAGGVACTKMLYKAGVRNIIPFDSVGAIYRGRKTGMNPIKDELVQSLNPDNEAGSLSQALKGADFFLGVSKPNVLSQDDVRGMAKDAIVFAMANPVPEIMPDQIQGVARIVASGRSDYPNQVNNVLCFPGLFKGALNCRARAITDNMKLAAAHAISSCVKEEELGEDHIIPSIFDGEVLRRVSEEVERAAVKDGVAREIKSQAIKFGGLALPEYCPERVA